MAKKTVRLNLTLSPEAKERLEKLQEETDADTLAEVVRRAIKLYDYSVTCQNRGEKLMLTSENGNRELLIL